MTVTSAAERQLSGYPLFRRGKVRDTYDLDELLLVVSTDRVSAFDVILPTSIPDKGKILNQLSARWFELTSYLTPNHFESTEISTSTELGAADRDWLRGRSMIVRKAERIDIECVVRDYLAGSAWTEYVEHGTVAGVSMPAGLALSDRLPEPLFTPAIKNESGHDENISVDRLRAIVGSDLAGRLEQTSMTLFTFASTYAREHANLILADTKFEFGTIEGELTLIDEIFTPDSSRYWDIETYQPGVSQPSFDKQFLRNWLETLDWDKQPPGPAIPDNVVSELRSRYLEAFRRLMGNEPDFS